MAREKAKDPRKDAPTKGRPSKAKDKSAPVVESPAAPLDAEVRRTRLKTLITLGLLMFAFVGYQLWGTGLETSRGQSELTDEFASDVGTPEATTDSTM